LQCAFRCGTASWSGRHVVRGPSHSSHAGLQRRSLSLAPPANSAFAADPLKGHSRTVAQATD
jgi:hypothetical protein